MTRSCLVCVTRVVMVVPLEWLIESKVFFFAFFVVGDEPIERSHHLVECRADFLTEWSDTPRECGRFSLAHSRMMYRIIRKLGHFRAERAAHTPDFLLLRE